MHDDQKLLDLARKTGETLLERGLVLATAESCTGGWVAKCLTDVPGSSAWFELGLVTYANAQKMALLDVDEASLETHGAVSEETVREMAVGALTVARAKVSLAVSGIAGPDGGTAEKPVGLIWFAWADAEGVRAESRQFSGERDAVRRQAVGHALEGVLRFCERAR